jgi:drug/metabolite transporter (DMT)-like permease
VDKRLAYLFIVIGASLWGFIGIFVKYLYDIGFTPTQVVSIRVFVTALTLVVVVYFKNRKLFKIKPSDSKYFVGTGIFSILFFNWCMFSAIKETSISIAAILLYTAPAFVTIFSRILFKEWLTKRKVAALFITFVGCSFVIGVFPHANGSVSLYGLILGLGSGLFYSLYSIFGKFALRKYDSLTVTVYTFVFAAIAIIPFSGLWSMLPLLLNSKAWLSIFGLSILSTVLAFILYTKGLSAVESSRASIIATVEPVIAALSSLLIFHEKLNPWQYFGIILVIIAVIIVQESMKKSSKKKALLNESM